MKLLQALVVLQLHALDGGIRKHYRDLRRKNNNPNKRRRHSICRVALSFCKIGKEINMEQNLNQIDTAAADKVTAVFSMIIDGKTYTIHLFFPSSKAETMQEKTERMLRTDILNAIKRGIV